MGLFLWEGWSIIYYVFQNFPKCRKNLLLILFLSVDRHCLYIYIAEIVLPNHTFLVCKDLLLLVKGWNFMFFFLTIRWKFMLALQVSV